MSDQDSTTPTFKKRVRDALRTERSDPHLKAARQHIYPDLREVSDRVGRYLDADAQIRSTVVALLVRRIEELQPGARAGGLAIISTGLATAATIAVTVVSVVVAGAFGLLVASVNPATGSIVGVTSESISTVVLPVTWIVLAAAVLVAMVGWAIWNFQHANDKMRAIHMAWLSLYRSAVETDAPADRGLAWWRRRRSNT